MLLKLVQFIKTFTSYQGVSYAGSLTLHSMVLLGFVNSEYKISNDFGFYHNKDTLCVNAVFEDNIKSTNQNFSQSLQGSQIIFVKKDKNKELEKNEGLNNKKENIQNSSPKTNGLTNGEENITQNFQITPNSSNKKISAPNNLSSKERKKILRNTFLLQLMLNPNGKVINAKLSTEGHELAFERHVISIVNSWSFKIQGKKIIDNFWVEIPLTFRESDFSL